VALGLDPEKTKRIVFHEITKSAIEKAVANPRTIDMKRVDAQQARRVLDRLVGYELSPVLWKKIRAGLSAGRVQSVAVRLIVEREREIKAFTPAVSFKVTANFKADKQSLPAELDKRLESDKAARQFFDAINDATFKVASVDQKPGSRSPGPPFTTSTLQQEAARRLGYSVRQTMTLAQKLYEHGHITYMRTDSTILSGLAINAAKAYITKNFGPKYSQVRQFQTRAQSAQEAHEAIRPTNISQAQAGADNGQKKLYELIWRRAMASQMEPANIEKTTVAINISGRPEQFIAEGEVLVFDGYLKVYGGGKDDIILPPLKVGQSLQLESASALETYSRPPARYSEATLVRKLEQLEIGRPSTYAPTISVIQDRGYVEKGDVAGEERTIKEIVLEAKKVTEKTLTIVAGNDRSKLLPTSLADIVTDFLVKYFGDIVDYDFTARAETRLDQIAEGKLTSQDMLDDFYKMFHPLVEKSAKADRAEAAQARQIGTDPKTGKPVIARFGRFGPMLQLGDADAKDKDAPKPKFAPLPDGTSLDSVTLEEALPMFELPRQLGTSDDGQPIITDIGRFGPYVKVGPKFISIKGQNPLTITPAEAKQIIKDQAEIRNKRMIADYGAVKVLRGPYGPYVTDGKKNAKIPKGQAPEAVTETKAKEILAQAPVGKGRFKKR
jgi:DNA topoisomerase I